MKHLFTKRTAQLTLLGLVFFIAIRGAAPLHAQLSQGGKPQAQLSSLRSAELQSRLQALTLQVQPTPAQKRAALQAPALSVWQTGVQLNVDCTPTNSGMLMHDVNGRTVWILPVSAPHAKYIQLHFGAFNLPQGGKLFCLTQQGDVLLGAFTEKNNTSLQQLPLAPIPTDKLWVYYEGPAHSALIPQLRITQIAYGMQSLSSIDNLRVHKPGEPWFTEGFECAPEVITQNDVRQLMYSPLLLIVRGTSVCSGALINNTASNGKAYVLTAAHCVNKSFAHKGDYEYSKESARQTVFFFNFRSPTGNPPTRGVEEQCLAGAKLVALDESKDLCLLEIVGIDNNELYKPSGGIPASFMPYYAGWNSEPDVQGPFYGLHHPYASTMRYNRYEAANLSIVDFNAGPNIQWRNAHWHIPRWTIGTTQPGSSGSPLFDKDFLIIGALSGGFSQCSNPVNDYYYAVNRCFNKREGAKDSTYLQPFLDPTGSGLKKCKPYLPYGEAAPKRLSYNLYAPWRDSTELTKPEQFNGLHAIANEYAMPSKSRVLGVYAVGYYLGIEDLPELILTAVNDKGEERTLYKKPIQFPKYKTFLYGKEREDTRSTRQNVEFFISTVLDDGTFPVVQKNEKLYVGFAAPKGKQIQFAFMRAKQLKSVAPHAFVKMAENSKWIPAAAQNIPKNFQYQGSYWFDPIVQSLESHPGDSAKVTKPVTFAFEGNTLKVQLPQNDADGALIKLFDAEGRTLLQANTTAQRVQLRIPESIAPNQFFIIFVKTNGHIFTQKLLRPNNR